MGFRKLRLNAGILQCRLDASTCSQTTRSPSNPFSTPLNKSIFSSRIQYSSLIYKQEQILRKLIKLRQHLKLFIYCRT